MGATAGRHVPTSGSRTGRRILGVLALLGGVATAGGAGAQTFSVERRLGANGRSGVPISSQDARVAFDGTSYVIVWSDRDPIHVNPLPSRGAYVTRVGAAGELLDPNGIRLDGVSTLVAYAAFRAAPWGSVLYGPGGMELRLDREGRRLADPPPALTDSTLIGGKDRFTLSCSEGDCLATWHELTVGAVPAGYEPTTVGLAVDACGEPVPGTELELPLGRFVAEYGGEVHLLFGFDQRGLDAQKPVAPQAAAIAREGRVLWGPRPVAQIASTVTANSALALGFGAGAFLGAWVSLEGGSSKLWVTSISPTGESGPARLLREATEPIGSLSLAWEGADFRLVFGEADTLYSLRLDPSGAPIDADATVITAGDCLPTEPGIASNGEGALVVWSWPDGCVGAPPSALRIPGDGAAPESLSFATSGVPIERASFASNGTGYVGAWPESKTEGSGIYVQHFDGDGVAVGPATLAIPRNVDATTGFGAFVVDGHYFVTDNASTFNVDTETPELVPAEPCVMEPATYLVPHLGAYSSGGEDSFPENELTVDRVRVDGCGSTLESARIWSTLTSEVTISSPLLAFDGEHFALVWYESGNSVGDSVRFVSFDAAGQVLSVPRVLSTGNGSPVALAWAGDAFLLVLGSGQMWRLVGADGVLTAQAAGSTGSSIDTALIVEDGDASLVGFSGDDVSVARVTPEGSVSSPVVVANDRERETLIALVPAGDGRALIAYDRFDDEPSTMVNRTFYRVLGTGACRSLDRCASAACDECCTSGCTEPSPSPECSAPVCSATCPAGTRCAAGLGCLPEPPKPSASPMPSHHQGCACTSTPSGKSPAWALVALLGALAHRRRKRRRMPSP